MDEPSFVVDVRPILEELGGTVTIDADVDLPVITLGEETFAPLGPGHLVAQITNTGAGLVASGTIEVEMDATCSRCLCQFTLPVDAPVEGFYVLPGREDEIPEEQEVGVIAEGGIDLMDQMLAALALELPFAPVHDEECQGMCPQCGADLNEGPCGCRPDAAGSPFAALKDLLPPEDDE